MIDKTAFSKRNMAIDMLRALTMLTMIFVNDFWKVHGVPHWLEHADVYEDFMGLADVVFPCFLFAVGMSIPYAIERRYAKALSAESTVSHILSRTLSLIVMGTFLGNSEARVSADCPYPIGIYWLLMVVGILLVWNRYPKAQSTLGKRLTLCAKCVGAIILLYLIITYRSAKGGVFSPYSSILGIIGWTYLVCAMTYYFCRTNVKRIAAAWGVFVLISLLTSSMRDTLGGHAIINLPSEHFIYGMLSILRIENGSHVVLTMSGMLLSLLSVKFTSRSDAWKICTALATSAVFAVLGICAHHFWILSKIWATPTWVCFIIAISVTLYALLTYLDAHGLTGWFAIIRPAGTATLTAYMMPYVFYACSSLTGITLPDCLTHGIVGIANCLCFSLVVITCTGILERLHITLKV